VVNAIDGKQAAVIEPARQRGDRMQIMLSGAELAAIDKFRFDKRMPSRAAAVRELLKRGLAAAAAAVKNEQRFNLARAAPSRDVREGWSSAHAAKLSAGLSLTRSGRSATD
jgi:hypothetical protein